jgi:hypothetical protein
LQISITGTGYAIKYTTQCTTADTLAHERKAKMTKAKYTIDVNPKLIYGMNMEDMKS